MAEKRVRGSKAPAGEGPRSGLAGAKPKPKRRTRSPHPGIVLVEPTGRRASWRMRFTDPETGRKVDQRIDPVAAGSAEARRALAIQKSKALAKRKMEIATGAPLRSGLSLPEAVERYFSDASRLRPRTVEINRAACARLLHWASISGVRTIDDLTLAKLTAFRSWLSREPRNKPSKGGMQGRKVATGEHRKPGAVNVELRAVRTVLGYLRRLGLLHLSNDALSDGLKQLPIEHEVKPFLKAPEIKALLAAALAHDSETFKATRAEHRDRLAGSTLRYKPVAPLILAALLTGARINELVSLTWGSVDLDALGTDGIAVGEIRISAAHSKTNRGRVIDLGVSPALRDVLLLMKGEGDAPVFGLSGDEVKAAVKRLAQVEGAPRWTWNTLRRTCGTWLVCAPSIYGSAGAFLAAKRAGHSLAVAERHYVSALRGISPDARTLEDALGIGDGIEAIKENLRMRRKR